MIGTFGAYLTTRIVAPYMPGATVPARLAVACALVGTSVYIIGVIASFYLPEPKSEELPT